MARIPYATNKSHDQVVVAKGYGDTIIKNHRTKGVNCGEEEHAANRRTEIKVISI
jgi:hypothetical protein